MIQDHATEHQRWKLLSIGKQNISIYLVLSVFKDYILSLITSSGKVCIPMVAYTLSVSNQFFSLWIWLLFSRLLLGKIYMRHLHVIIINTDDQVGVMRLHHQPIMLHCFLVIVQVPFVIKLVVCGQLHVVSILNCFGIEVMLFSLQARVISEKECSWKHLLVYLFISLL